MLIMGRIREKNGHPLGACFFVREAGCKKDRKKIYGEWMSLCYNGRI